MSPRVRLALIGGTMAVVAAAAIAGRVVDDLRGTSVLHDLAWVAAFAAAELCAVRIHFRRDSHTFSLSEMPLVAALYTLSPGALAVTRCAGTLLALAVGRRQGPVKLLFNGALVALSSVVAAGVFSLWAPAGPSQPSGWLWALAAALAGETVSMALIHVTLLAVEGTAPWQTLPKAFLFGLVAIAVNGSAGLLVALALPQQPVAILLVVGPALTMLGLYHAYATERRSHQSSDLLYEATRDLHRSINDSDVVQRVLHRVRVLLGADIAAVVLAGDAEDPPVVLLDAEAAPHVDGRGAVAWLERRSAPPGSAVVAWPPAARAAPTRGMAVVADVGEPAGVRCSMLVAQVGGAVR
ncbi:MAG TPA: hypothetical protein VFO60_07160, partial [Candidatus Dormibacteraeota bacterium]|nr:hypothetical protein [Candidatus Dormibacteraeota bacterium]